jgi:anti-sigma factor RsiW
MHNCRLTRNVLLHHALGEMPPAQTSELLAELDHCAACQAEFAALRNTLRVSRQALRSAAPPEEFWHGYRARLRDKLEHHQEDLKQASTLVGLPFGSRLWNGLGKLVTTSVRVPAPAALAIALLIGILSFSALSRSREQADVAQSTAQSTSIANIPAQAIQAPVVEERVVTRVVYVERKASRANAPASLRRADLAAANIRARSDASGKTAMSLVGFKPTDQVKLTVIKGSYQDEK